jgi:hypothetical protein
MVVAALFIHAPLEPHADSLVTPLHSTAPWYFLWAQGLLKLGDKVIWGLIVPGLFTGLLLILPYVEVGPSRRYGDRRLGLSAGAITVFVFAILSYMGSPWYAVQTSVEQEAVATVAPQTHPGPLRLSNWDEIAYGTFTTDELLEAPNDTMAEILGIFKEELDHIESDVRENHVGLIVIEDWQTDLKKITMRVLWDDLETGEPGEFSQTVYIHRSSDYGQGE